MPNPENFEAFLRNYKDMVYTTAIRLLGNAADAEDMTQVVFLKAYQHFADLEKSPTAGGWLKKVTKNLCLNHLNRYRFRWRFFSELKSEDSDPEFIETCPAPEASPSDLIKADQKALIEQTIQRLPKAQRIPLALFYFHELSYQEIADQLKISLSKVKSDIYRGREALKKSLSNS